MSNSLHKDGNAGLQPALAKPAWENPLIPNKKMRAIYKAMVELRLLEVHLTKHRNKSKRSSAQEFRQKNDEGCRVSTALDLRPGDLVSDTLDSIATSFLRGTKLPALLDRARSAEHLTKQSLNTAASGELYSVGSADDRIRLAIGAALALKSLAQHCLVVAYIHSNELTLAEWKSILRLAASASPPIIFVVMPENIPFNRPGQLSLLAGSCNLPGVPVDASDPVALYRVAQESMLRAKAGGGPVLMECIPFQIAKQKPTLHPKQEPTSDDPVTTMRQFLLQREIASESWFRAVENRFAARLLSASQAARPLR